MLTSTSSVRTGQAKLYDRLERSRALVQVDKDVPGVALFDERGRVVGSALGNVRVRHERYRIPPFGR